MHFANFARPWTRRVPDWTKTWNVHNFIPRSFKTSQQQKLGSWSGTSQNRYWKQEQSSNISKCFGSFGKKSVRWLLLFCFQMLWKVATFNRLNSNTLTKPYICCRKVAFAAAWLLRLLSPLVIEARKRSKRKWLRQVCCLKEACLPDCILREPYSFKTWDPSFVRKQHYDLWYSNTFEQSAPARTEEINGNNTWTCLQLQLSTYEVFFALYHAELTGTCVCLCFVIVFGSSNRLKQTIQ